MELSREMGQEKIACISVKMARIDAKKSQEACARQLDLSLTGYRRKETGKSKFYAHELTALSNFLGVPYELFCESMCHNKTQNEKIS